MSKNARESADELPEEIRESNRPRGMGDTHIAVVRPNAPIPPAAPPAPAVPLPQFGVVPPIASVRPNVERAPLPIHMLGTEALYVGGPVVPVPAPVVPVPAPGAAVPAPGAAVPAPGAAVPAPGAAVPARPSGPNNLGGVRKTNRRNRKRTKQRGSRKRKRTRRN